MKSAALLLSLLITGFASASDLNEYSVSIKRDYSFESCKSEVESLVSTTQGKIIQELGNLRILIIDFPEIEINSLYELNCIKDIKSVYGEVKKDISTIIPSNKSVTICGLLVKESPLANLSISYNILFSNSKNTYKVEMTTKDQDVQNFLESAISKTAICTEGRLQGNKLLIDHISEDRVGLPRIGKSN